MKKAFFSTIVFLLHKKIRSSNIFFSAVVLAVEEENKQPTIFLKTLCFMSLLTGIAIMVYIMKNNTDATEIAQKSIEIAPADISLANCAISAKAESILERVGTNTPDIAEIAKNNNSTAFREDLYYPDEERGFSDDEVDYNIAEAFLTFCREYNRLTPDVNLHTKPKYLCETWIYEYGCRFLERNKHLISETHYDQLKVLLENNLIEFFTLITQHLHLVA